MSALQESTAMRSATNAVLHLSKLGDSSAQLVQESQFDDAEESVPHQSSHHIGFFSSNHATSTTSFSAPTTTVMRGTDPAPYNHSKQLVQTLSTKKSAPATVVAEPIELLVHHEDAASRTTGEGKKSSSSSSVLLPKCLNGHDVLVGIESGVFPNAGNQFFRRVIRAQQEKYSIASTFEKQTMVDFVLSLVGGLSPPGRFFVIKHNQDWKELETSDARIFVEKSLANGVIGIEGWQAQRSLSMDSRRLQKKRTPAAKTRKYTRKKQKVTVSNENVEAPKFSQLLQAAAIDEARGSESQKSPSLPPEQSDCQTPGSPRPSDPHNASTKKKERQVLATGQNHSPVVQSRLLGSHLSSLGPLAAEIDHQAHLHELATRLRAQSALQATAYPGLLLHPHEAAALHGPLSHSLGLLGAHSRRLHPTSASIVDAALARASLAPLRTEDPLTADPAERPPERSTIAQALRDAQRQRLANLSAYELHGLNPWLHSFIAPP